MVVNFLPMSNVNFRGSLSVMTAIPNIRQLAQSDVPRAKVELDKHREEIVVLIDPHICGGQWDLIEKERSGGAKGMRHWNGAGSPHCSERPTCFLQLTGDEVIASDNWIVLCSPSVTVE